MSDDHRMTYHDFCSRVKEALPPGTVLPNPGAGTSKIKGYSNAKVSYIRGTSTISISFTDLFTAYTEFSGKEVSSRDLRDYAPQVFDSAARPAGHSCNCTFLFVVLTKLGLADGVRGEGKRNQPFRTKFL